MKNFPLKVFKNRKEFMNNINNSGQSNKKVSIRPILTYTSGKAPLEDLPLKSFQKPEENNS